MENNGMGIRPGGNDVFANAGAYLLVTDNVRGDKYGVEAIDFYIDESGNGFVYFDNEEQFAQTNVNEYEVLEQIFYAQYSVEEQTGDYPAEAIF